MITSRVFAGRRYAVLGLARSGLATVEALIASGAGVTAWDDREDARDDAMALGADIGNPIEIDLVGFAGVVVSPGVPLNRHPIAAHAREAHVPVIGDVELFAEARGDLPPHKIVGITGTNGKSTVTALIAHMLECAGVPALMGGNIGLPILSRDPLTPVGGRVGVYVLELSSYQIDLSHSLACDIAVLTNLSPDHLDRYDGFAGYAASKARLFSFQHQDQVAIVAVDDDPSKMIAGRINHRLYRVSAKDVDPADQLRWPALQGPHNAQNAVCAIAVCRVLGLNDEQIERGLATYKSLPHRMELVGEVGGVSWFNDSKATNAASAAPALAAVPPAPDQRLHWIAGGKAKGDGLAACRPWFGHVKRAYLIGEAMAPFAAEIGDAIPLERSGDMVTAVRQAAAAAQPGDVVLLSPACASFDQFRDYEQRGDAFRAAVEALGA
ncbi:UDP-N-acetylmuramoyl-L-alanine--D-glutamate ligase [Sphingopyxis sp. RIFCSPHIGHO2_12_FULL_65_19]|uniref:UDP-N-acetylmuramoyl-L-alanine--D-glutamate ligase n=1 Tax=Sphingopyxis sp. RIFCSPHIGHO2_12_FULL_65_19 TaxID=1802172 RepID=UPI0008D44A03|nr:UDP-N-acetylmuramoyl-L-alanine--D-glutamate ligase [Sphingopyxis sp. RIFCSPHIGHO2_12_FULL_65_19]OHD10177.1 MAG: UDP-N-acetylmuramoylalanine--D-glutamate ligase [Sphingopyxis sp. RIFCSPHIGHO2_12_FULL_65_19]